MGGFVSAEAAGKVKWNVGPRPPSPLAQIRPPCDSTIDMLIAKPMPLPCGFVVKNASNIWSALPRGSPGPVSFAEISIWPSSPNRDFTVTMPPSSVIASMPFIIQVHEHLLKLHSIRHGHWKIVFDIGVDRYSVSSGFASQHPGYFGDDLIYRDQPPFGRGFLVQ